MNDGMHDNSNRYLLTFLFETFPVPRTFDDRFVLWIFESSVVIKNNFKFNANA